MPADTQGRFVIDPPLDTENLLWLESALKSDHAFVEVEPNEICRWELEVDTIDFPSGELFDSNRDLKWIIYMMIEYLIPWGYKVSGILEWNNFYSNDYGKILITDNLLTIYRGEVVYTPEFTKDLDDLV